ncbi:hypothetical protein P3339_06145 [Microbulbifer sp. MLAF003]|uniref:hypothetical protein n=1 Tax=unclassified Microbulbifer TaxID=2619833 RepID=UPI0024AE5B29|nr:hypothetical protein [Microbulbifer sp. MLAF003]WHI52361.1 hypothetical protein P3339_06145 [Microbulbifer sp. MLAF003]
MAKSKKGFVGNNWPICVYFSVYGKCTTASYLFFRERYTLSIHTIYGKASTNYKRRSTQWPAKVFSRGARSVRVSDLRIHLTVIATNKRKQVAPALGASAGRPTQCKFCAGRCAPSFTQNVHSIGRPCCGRYCGGHFVGSLKLL